MIPKIIHYCWFGKNPKPALALKCIESWKKYCPDYEIKEWNEDNYDVEFCDYSRQAYEKKKWAFVSDVARFKILYDNGGLYFDTDVELLKPIDFLLDNTGFLGFETTMHGLFGNEPEIHWLVNPGLGMGAEKNNPVLENLLNEYKDRSFVNVDGSLNLKTICEYTSKFFYKGGMQSDNVFQKILGFSLYPKEYFNPMDSRTGKISLTKDTISIHHYAASWTFQNEKRNVKLFRMLNSLLGKKGADFIRYFYRKIKGKV